MAKKYSKELIFAHKDQFFPYRDKDFQVKTTATHAVLVGLCVSVFCRTFKIPARLIRNRTQRVKITIELPD